MDAFSEPPFTLAAFRAVRFFTFVLSDALPFPGSSHAVLLSEDGVAHGP